MIDKYLSDFISYLQSEKGLAKNTLFAYQRDIQSFIDFINCREINWRKIINYDIVNFISEKRANNYANSSISRYIASLKVFFRFMKREQYVSEDIAKFIEFPKTETKVPVYLTHKEMNHILDQPNINKIKGARDKAIIETLYSTGMRVSELIQLKKQDIKDRMVLVNGKGGKQRLIPIGHYALMAINRYREMKEDDCENIFEITRTTVWKKIKKYSQDINKNISPHTLRHTFATHLLDNEADLRVIQELLGHSSIESTDRYTQVSFKHVKTSFYKHHPRK